MKQPILLFTLYIGEQELKVVPQAFNTNSIAYLGFDIDTFERKFWHTIGFKDALSLPSAADITHESLTMIIDLVGKNRPIVM